MIEAMSSSRAPQDARRHSPTPRVEPADLEAVLVPDGPRSASAAGRHAAVAAVFRAGEVDTELLFIQRAEHEGDPWSGHMAFPGGRAHALDVDSHATAERETAEELGLDLRPARRLGSLSDVDGGRASNNLIAVSAHCYWLDGVRPELVLNHEVAAAVWVPVGQLLDEERHIDYWYPPSRSTFPGIQLDVAKQVIWGLTLRLLADLFARLDRRFIIR